MTTSHHDRPTLAFYDGEAEAYAARGARADAAETVRAFLARLAPGAHILDLGSGDGRHAAAMEAAGFEVTALDGSAGLAEIASARLARPVRVQTFEEMEDVAAFDAVWANASLLHVPREGLADIFARIHRALRPGGLFFASFKTGGEEGRDTFGRYYNRPDRPFLEAALAKSGPWAETTFETGDGGGYDGVPTQWISLFARKPGPDGGADDAHA